MFATLNFPANSKRENPHNKLLRSSIYIHILYTVLASIKMNINLVGQIFFFRTYSGKFLRRIIANMLYELEMDTKKKFSK